jgi:hypothetical protein
MAELTVISWRAIPAQVVAGSGRTAVRAQLSERFQEAIDAAAMVAGLHGTDGYLAEWRRETVQATDDDPATAVEAERVRIETEYTDDRLARLVRAQGKDDEA